MGSTDFPSSSADAPATESALIVPVPEAEAAVAEWRAALDDAAAWGVPAHVTVLYPFLPPSRLGTEEIERLREVIAGMSRFEVTFDRVGWFGAEVVWLAPDPGDGFRQLTAAVWSAFPDCPPYGGAFDDSVPHLTIAARRDLNQMRTAADDAATHLPIKAAVRSVHLYQGSGAPGAWREIAELPLKNE